MESNIYLGGTLTLLALFAQRYIFVKRYVNGDFSGSFNTVIIAFEYPSKCIFNSVSNAVH